MLNAGDRFGDYTVVRKLGQGGMGAVFLLEGANGGLVAAKILDPEAAHDPESRKRFLREAELTLGVKHANLVETYDVGEDPDTGLCYILMEYIPGGSLADRIDREGALPIKDALKIVYQIASVLELAREKGIVHRDIKPDNIMFGADGQAKLADLGIARLSNGTNATTVTQTGTMIGTPAYMSPEQMLDSHAVDCRADIYSLGVVFYEMLAGARPNKDDTAVQLMAKAMQGVPIPDVREMRPEVSAAISGLVSFMCAMNADERVSTPREVTLAISQIAHGREVTIRQKRPAPQPAAQSSDSSRGRKLMPLVVLALIAAAFGGFFALNRPKAAVPAVGRPEAVAPIGSEGVREASEQTDASTKAEAQPEQARAVRSAAVITNGPPLEIDLGEAEAQPEQPRAVRSAAVITNGPPLEIDLGENVKMLLMKCPAGTFTMGYPDSDWPSHKPHRVTISRPFWIGHVPVAVCQWERLMGEFPLQEKDKVFNHRWLAVGRVPWDAMEWFCAKLTEKYGHLLPKGYVFRLPTNAEWEYACKAGSTDPTDPYVQWKFTSYEAARAVSVKRDVMETFYRNKGYDKEDKWDLLLPIKTRRPNRWGLYDMIGLGAECLLDTYPKCKDATGKTRTHAMLARDDCPVADATDPLTVCRDLSRVRLMRSAPDGGPQSTGARMTFGVGDGCGWGHVFRVVAGPDLLKERGVPKVVYPKLRAVPKQGEPKIFSLGNGNEMEFVNCPAGEFTMGWDCGLKQFAPHPVKITRPFWALRHMVSRRQWNVLMPAKPMTPQEKALGGDAGAVPSASCQEIAEYCAKLTARFRDSLPKGYVFRLPTLAEYEYLWRAGGGCQGGVYGEPPARAGDFRRLGIGQDGRRKILKAAGCDLSDADWKAPSRYPLVAVGRGLPNAWGLTDFAGNGDCWVLDTFPASKTAAAQWGVVAATDLEWNLPKEDPLFWSGDEKASRMFVDGRMLRPWWHPGGDKRYAYCRGRWGCVSFRLVLAPDLLKERGLVEPTAAVSRATAVATPSLKPVPKQGRPISLKLKKAGTMEFVNCPAGSFTMGWDCGLPGNVNMPHPVKITRPFWAGRYLVTRRQWNDFMPPKTMTEQEKALGGDDAAVPGVSRREVDEFCEQLTRRYRKQIPKGYVIRLPTAAENEYMWRAGGGCQEGPYGEPPVRSGDYERLGLGVAGKRKVLRAAGCDLTDDDWRVPARQPTAKVGQGLANAWGLFDFVGNGVQILLDSADRQEVSSSGLADVKDVDWSTMVEDPLLWSRNREMTMLLFVSDNRPWWGTPNDKRWCSVDGKVRCHVFRLVIGPDLEKERLEKERKAGKAKRR